MATTLHKLSARHHRAVALRIAGHSPRAIASTLGVEVRTIYVWMSDPLIKDEVRRVQGEVDHLVTQRLADSTLAGTTPGAVA